VARYRMATFARIIPLFLFGLIVFNTAPVTAKDLGTLLSPGALSWLHKDAKGLTGCTKCHALRGGVRNEKCLECHKDISSRLSARKGFHASVSGRKCFSCHSEHQGKSFNLIKWKEKSFDHKKTGYDLLGKHGKVACRKCHTAKTKQGQKSFLGLKTDCISCHKKDDKHKGELGKDCAKCHTEQGWKKTKFNHDTTKYPLRGKHLQQKCKSCHPQMDKGKFKIVRFDTCNAPGCHDNKKRGGLTHGKKQFKGKKCESCHTVENWKPSLYRHNTKRYAGYRLEGKHLKLACAKCHRADPVTKIVHYRPFDTRTCNTKGCHDSARRKNIHGKQFAGRSCDECHTSKGWKPTTFSHSNSKYKGFKLKGKHTKLKCAKCHKSKRKVVFYKPIKYDSCTAKGCHDTRKRGNIHGKQFKGRNCLECHSERGWKPTVFSHSNPKYKGFKLKGKHAKLKCAKCHRPDRWTKVIRYKPIKTGTCAAKGCHDTRKRGNIHGKQFRGRGCDNCHAMESWKPTIFSHSSPKYKGFKLKGKHAKLKCAKCHRPDRRTKAVKYKPIKYDSCTAKGCHDTRKRGNIHGKQFKGRNCLDCHTEQRWKPTAFSHSNPKYKGFKLKGKHAKVKCAKCHRPDRRTKAVKYKPIKYDSCTAKGCHDTRKRGNIHGTQFKGRNCLDCHTEQRWKPTAFSHSNPKYKGFKLKGKHAKVKCAKCHKKDSTGTAHFKPIKSGACADCHADEHKGQFKEKKCEDCHTETGWKPSLFRHSDPQYKGFKLTGKHAKAKCEGCHKKRSDGKVRFKPIKSDCVDCHKKDDKHKGSLGPNCRECHSPATWKPTGGFHDLTAMPLEGAHKRADCVACHKTPGSFAGLSGGNCTNCHIDAHIGQFGTECVDCHNAETWEPLRFRHSTTGFRLEGAHRITNCKNCHQNRVYRNTPTDCVDCHRDRFVAATFNVFHQSASTDCVFCHTVYSFQPATNHQHATWTFDGVHASLKSRCASCHQSGTGSGLLSLKWPTAKVASDCNICHGSKFTSSSASSANAGIAHAAGGAASDCTTCHSSSFSTWTQNTFRHTTMTFVGPHSTLAAQSFGSLAGSGFSCTSCHNPNTATPKWAGAANANDCDKCHQTNFASANSTSTNASIGHAASGASADCTTCHALTASTFTQVNFTHASMTFVGPHSARQSICADCHNAGSATPKWPGASTAGDCNLCHASNFNAATTGVAGTAHGTVTVSGDCARCHFSTHVSWNQATFGHTTMTFVGAHTALQQTCSNCHVSGSSALKWPGAATAEDCNTCHISQYNPNSNTAHQASGANPTCTNCHKSTDTLWQQGTFAHTTMTFNGWHGSVKNSCSKCHSQGFSITGGSTSEEDCFVCHQSRFNSKHSKDVRKGCDIQLCNRCHRPTDGGQWNNGRNLFGGICD